MLTSKMSTTRAFARQRIFKAENMVKDHNRRITEMIKWIEKEYDDYYEKAVMELTE